MSNIKDTNGNIILKTVGDRLLNHSSEWKYTVVGDRIMDTKGDW